MFDVPLPDQIAEQPGIREVHLGSFHQKEIATIFRQIKEILED